MKPLISPYEKFPLSNVTVVQVVPLYMTVFQRVFVVICRNIVPAVTHVDRVDGRIIITVFVERQLWSESDGEIMAFGVS